MAYARSSSFSASFLSIPLALTAFVAVAAAPSLARAQAEPVACLSPDPAVWPAPSKPYFMVLVDTSGSMISAVPGAAPSCGYPSTRMGHAKCAVKNTVLSFGEVNFGLAQFASFMTGCGANCYGNDLNVPNPGCDVQCYTAEAIQPGGCGACGPLGTIGDPTTRKGGRILVPMRQDNHWGSPPVPTNIPSIMGFVDNNCTGNLEVVNTATDGPPYGKTPLNGSLRDMKRYFELGWTNPDNPAETYPTPLDANDRACRSINVILLTDGDETCDMQADAVNAATALFGTGVTVGGKNFKIKVHVINFAGGNQANTDAIAVAGGTGPTSYFATNETQLSTALANIVASAIKPETCDNTDNNCNGCTDEGFKHYCDVAQFCCAWVTPAQRTTCLNNYKASIVAQPPDGNLALLPCTTVAQQTQPANWLCFNPKETCDNIDNNCQDGIDENVLKCGNPPACPSTEICDQKDNDCDGQVNEGNVCGGGCVPATEVCDGCDNDCDGLIDEGIASVPCGFTPPANCAGLLACPQKANPGGIPGACVPGNPYSPCSNAPQGELCDGIDNDCDGTIDDGIAPVSCVPPGTPGGLVYGGTSQCVMGTQACGGMCNGFIGPSQEVCDGIDNDCDGVVDDNAFGVGQMCGVNQPPCVPGTTACVNGALVCQGGNQPDPEVCDGVDNDCDGLTDEAPLADGPMPGQNGCWQIPGNCCTFQNLSWCPPPGGTCNGSGSLTPPCNEGALACAGAQGWVCQNSKAPSTEVCDGIDNNCNGMTDEGNLPGVGAVCGSDVGECQTGLTECNNGIFDCANDIGPTQELCDGLDNDCDTVTDNGIAVGGPCTPAYDMQLYPGDRSFSPCQPGILECDGMGGQTCLNGVGPSPEICDGVDNDCDGTIDEVGAAPDGIDGTANPFPPPAGSIGDVCGVDTGECAQGNYACVNGQFACLGGQGAVPEECDCLDNDCNGATDNENMNGPAICGAGKDCVSTGGSCQCAGICGAGENPCPPGQKCELVNSSETGQPLGNYCVVDYDQLCGDCTTKTVTDANQTVVCAPAGTVLADCLEPPVCECKGQNGCQAPCFNVTCPAGEICAVSGPNAGKCGLDNCFNNPCQGCGKVCNLGSCVDNPCTDTSCPPGQACQPNDNFTDFACVGSCAGVDCPAGQACVAGSCVPTCDPECPMGQACDTSQMPPTCVTDQCNPSPCVNGACCDPVTGTCGNCPCEGVVCPDGQECKNGDCFAEVETTTSSSSSGVTSTGDTGATTGAGSTSGGQGGANADDSIWGLPTGGGGCACEVGAGATSPKDLGWALCALALALARRRRKAGAGGREVAR